MMTLVRFPNNHNLFAFINDASTLKPVPIGYAREEWFESREDALIAARNAGFWIDTTTGMIGAMA